MQHAHQFLLTSTLLLLLLLFLTRASDGLKLEVSYAKVCAGCDTSRSVVPPQRFPFADLSFRGEYLGNTWGFSGGWVDWSRSCLSSPGLKLQHLKHLDISSFLNPFQKRSVHGADCGGGTLVACGSWSLAG